MSWMIPRPIRDFVVTYNIVNTVRQVDRSNNETGRVMAGLAIGISGVALSENLIRVSLRTVGAATLALGVYSNLVSENVGGALTAIASPSVALLYVSGKVAKVGVEYLLTGNATNSLSEAGIGIAYLLASYAAAEVHDIQNIRPELKPIINCLPGEAVIDNIASKNGYSVCQMLLK